MSGLLLLLLAQAAPVAAAPVPDRVLAEQRGGFQLPNGIDVALTVQTQTAIDGAVVLRTVFQVDQGAPSLTIYAPKTGETVAVARGGGQPAQAVAAPSVTYDRTRGVEVMPGVAVSPAVAIFTAGAGGGGPVPAGLAPVAAGAKTDAGTVSESAANGIRAVSLQAADLTITHLAGNAFGSAIANSGSDRSIDTQTTISIGLSNVGPDVLGSAMFRIEDIALDTAAMRVR